LNSKFDKVEFPINGQQRIITKVVTDIDDTVVSSGGLNIFGITLGGIDKQYKRGQFYPGVTQFALELSSLKNSLPSKVSVLTARAREFKFALALKSTGKLCSAYRNTGAVNGLTDWGIGDVYYGSVAEWIFQGRKGLRKFLNFEIMMQNDEELMKQEGKYIFIGDTGEKDEDAGERIAAKYPHKVQAIFLHRVHPASGGQSVDRKICGSVPVLYFRTYVGAAVKAYRLNLLDKEALRRVARQAILDLTRLQQMQQARADVGQFLPPAVRQRRLQGLQQSHASRWVELLADLNECAFLDGLKKDIPPSVLQLVQQHPHPHSDLSL